MDTATLILEEMKQLRESVDGMRSEELQRMTTLETKVKPLFDNGQPGEITKLGDRLTHLEHWRIRLTSYAAALSATISVAVSMLAQLLFRTVR
jgi:hypothetical protein